ncbi:hypothetical protein CI109_106009 [Kwoniella shandongensis]|uniref:Uncharacterized protein n=1 Tax=Kwoniella shandongensis TaxID=1734106 RepID=A0A5M6BYA9_9TREE|nr:uncharacterized protein CI109_003942 [Kwoniella shandongensis]KAA5527683.1 hypothetical protein CI109_003942 [Kwoniella shandongensis]
MSFGGFGATSTAAKPTFGGFATPNPQASTSGGTSLFGAAPQQPSNPSTSLFGNTQQQQQQQPAQGGSGLFGSTTNAQSQPQTGSLFGSAPGGATSNTGTGLFGSTNTQQNQQQQQGGGGLFGQSQPQQQQQGGGGLFGNASTNTGGGLFGQTQAQKPAGTGLFGSTTQQQQPSSGGLFGSTAQNQQQPGTQQGGGLFGSTAQPTQGGGLFGSTAQLSQAGGLFGSTTQQPQQAGGSSLFGGGGGFGQQSQAGQQQGGSSLFGSTVQPQQQQQQQQQWGNSSLAASTSNSNPFGIKQEVDIETRIKNVQSAWDTNNPDCRFKYFFYNVVEEGTAGRYGRPAGANDDAKWAKALRDNPDPNSMVPVLATGWADVKKREQAQENLASVHQQRIKEITQALSHTRQTSLSASIRLQNLQARQNQLQHRLIHLAAQTPQYIPLIQSTAFRQEEAEMQAQLENVKGELEGKGKNVIRAGLGGAGTSKGRLLGQLNELWGQLEEIRRRRKTRSSEGRDGWLADEKALAEVADILATQQTALQKLSGLVHDAVFDAEVMRQGMGLISNGER